MAPSAVASSEESPAVDVFARVAASVVAVGVLAGAPGGETFTVLASGIAWDGAGHVVTPYSQINTALRQNGPRSQVAVMLRLPDGAAVTYPAAAVAREPSLELTVLQLPPGAAQQARLQPIVLTASSTLRIGQDAYLIGSTPTGERALSAGVVSATGRSVPAPNGQTIRNVVQSDAEVTALGLGGALVDSAGRLIGMPTVAYTKPGIGRSSGVNFAVSSDSLLAAVPSIIAYGNVAGRR